MKFSDKSLKNISRLNLIALEKMTTGAFGELWRSSTAYKKIHLCKKA